MSNKKQTLQDKIQDRIKEAFFLNILGFPLNATAFISLVLWSFADPKMWFFAIPGELIYLVFMTSSQAVTDSINKKLKLQQQIEWERKKNRILNKLSPMSRKRFYQISTTGQSISNIAAQAIRDGLSVDKDKLKQVNQLLWLALKLLYSRELMIQNIKDNSKDTLINKIENLKANRQRETDPKLVANLDSTIETMEKRLDMYNKVTTDIKGIDLDLLRIEEQLALLQNVTTLEVQAGKGNVSKQIDNVQQSIDDTSEWMESTKDLFASFDDDLTETPPDDVFISGEATKSM